MRNYDIKLPNEGLRSAIQQKIDNLNKPKGSLGTLEDIAMQICLIEQRLNPTLCHPCHILLGADHGIEREGVSASPREVTWQQMLNFARGGGGVNMFCRQHGFELHIVDVGVDHDLTGVSGIENRKIAYGTRNFLHEAAMTYEQLDQALDIGAELADNCRKEGCNVVCIGEMGIANTSPSSIWMSLFLHIPLEKCTGAGSGLDSGGISHKQEVLRQALDRYTKLEPQTTENAIRYFGGFEMVTAIGIMLRAAELKMTILIDGFIMSACALAAVKLYPAVRHYMIFGHQGDESGHRLLLERLGVKPLLRLGLRLGEGTGALCAYPIIDSAVRMMNEMDNFDHANITKYF